MWQIAAGLKTLDLNSAYAYLMVCRDFGDTSAVAVDGAEVVGFVAGYRPPREPNALFVWQVGVAESHQGMGIARRLITSVLDRCERNVTYLEATVTPDNVASRRLFESLADQFGAPCEISPCFPRGLFPDPSTHDAEELFRIGPFNTATKAGQ